MASEPQIANASHGQPVVGRGESTSNTSELGLLALIVLLALILRFWGTKTGLPWVYNADEASHFLPNAIGMFSGDLNPHYFVNPPGFTYAIYSLLRLRFLSADSVWSTYASDPGSVITVARAASVLISSSAVIFIYLAGKRLANGVVGLLSALLLATAFLPVFYAHFALNDAPTLAFVAMGLWAAAGVLRFGRDRDFIVAGIALGIAAAFKYTGGIVLIPIAIAAVLYGSGARDWVQVTRGLSLVLGVSAISFILLNPYALIDAGSFVDGLIHQSTASNDSANDKLGLTHEGGFGFYLWTFTWGLGLLTSLVAAATAVGISNKQWRTVAVLVPAALLFVLFMGSQGRFFGRWLLPVFPMVVLLAAIGVVELSRSKWAEKHRLGPALFWVFTLAMVAQPLWKTIHVNRVLSAGDTRNELREWMLQNIPEGSKVVVDPALPAQWFYDPANPGMKLKDGARWSNFPRSPVPWKLDVSHTPAEGGKQKVYMDQYVRSLDPRLIKTYAQRGYCWWIVSSTQEGRAKVDPKSVPLAIAYYEKLRRRGIARRTFSPYKPNAQEPTFDFDMSFNYYPSQFAKAGPQLTVYQLKSSKCQTSAEAPAVNPLPPAGN